MKYVIEIKEVDSVPKDWNVRSSWNENGLYVAKDESFSIYQVYDHGVGYITCPEMFKSTPFKEQGESVSESLLLKAIAAAAHAKVLT